MANTDLHQERQKLGPVQHLKIAAPTLPQAHGKLGRELRTVICRVAKQRLRNTPPAEFDQQIAIVRDSRRRLEARAASQLTLPVLREGLEEYLKSLDAWAAGSELTSILRGQMAGGQSVTPQELALWLQDDNAGCQTGMLRLAGGDVLFWHTEEDTIGLFDRPRLAELSAGGQSWHAFVYPYLLPGPAFGWHAGYFHAVDSLHLKRPEHGVPTAVAAWLAWRFGSAAYFDLVRICPFIDGCAVNRVERSAEGVAASVHEIGWLDASLRELPGVRNKLLFQANCVGRVPSRLSRRESLPAVERDRYCARGQRARTAIAELTAQAQVSPQQIVDLLAAKSGGSYANANADVKAHCVGLATTDRIELYVQSGAALPGDVYQPQFHA